MAAPESNPVGRPPKYKTPEEMQRIIDLYFLACKCHQNENEPEYLEGLSDDDLLVVNDIDDVFPTVTGMALALDLTRQSLLDYQEKDLFLDTIKKAKTRIESSIEQRLFYNNPTGSIFNLKNNFGWKDKTEQDTTIKGNLGLTDLSENELDRKLQQLESLHEQSTKD